VSIPQSLRPRPLSQLIHTVLKPPMLVAAIWLAAQSPAHAEVDASGCDAAREYRMCFTQRIQDNPLPPPIAHGLGRHWELGDLDADGDLDVLVGEVGTKSNPGNPSGTIIYAENIGTPEQPHLVQRATVELPIFRDVAPSLGDLDNDGDLDLVIRSSSDLLYYENMGTPTQPAFVLREGANSPLQGIGSSYSKLNLSDLDNDGDLDIVQSSAFNSGSPKGLVFYENVGTAKQAEFIQRLGDANPLHEFDTLLYAQAAIGDLDSDGDDDLWLIYRDENYQLHSLFYSNAGEFGRIVLTPYPESQSPLQSNDLTTLNVPALGDLDNDGDLDAVFHGKNFSAAYYENTGTPTAAQFSLHPLLGSPFYGAEHRIDSAEHLISVTHLVDLDTDGDLDFVYSYDNEGRISYYENVGTPSQVVFVPRSGSENPLQNIAKTKSRIQSLFDLDNDGDLDVLATKWGDFFYYENIGTPSQASFVFREHTQLFTDLNVSSSTFSLGDLDLDGDADLVMNTPLLRYFENIGSPQQPLFRKRPYIGERLFYPSSLFLGTSTDLYPSTKLVDLDNDRDLDLIIDSDSVAENTGSANRPVFKLLENTALKNPLHKLMNPAFRGFPAVGDIDADGDMDILVATFGTFEFYENTGIVRSDKFVLRNLPSGSVFPNGRGQYSFPNFSIFSHKEDFQLVDLDGDGDLDLQITDYNSSYSYFYGSVSYRPIEKFYYYENVSLPSQAIFKPQALALNIENPPANYGYPAPAFADLDGDGDVDMIAGSDAEAFETSGVGAIVGTDKSKLLFYENIGQSKQAPVFTPRLFQNNPLDSLPEVKAGSKLHLYDLDQDGDLDLLVQNNHQRFSRYRPTSVTYNQMISYYPNVGNAQQAIFNPPGYQFDMGTSKTYFVDIDQDKDMDLALYSCVGHMCDWFLYKNVGVQNELPVFEGVPSEHSPLRDLDFPFNVAFGDVEGNGKLDALFSDKHYELETFPPKPASIQAVVKGSLYGQSYLKQGYLSVPLRCRDACQVITYSLDGSAPNLPYTEPLQLQSNTLLKFQAVDVQGQLTPIFTERYVFDTQAPQIIFNSPTSQCTTEAFSSLNISGTVTDESEFGLRHLHLQIQNGKLFLQSDFIEPFSILPDWWRLSTENTDWQFEEHHFLPLDNFHGEFIIRVRAIDHAGNISIQEHKVETRNSCL